MSNLLPLAQWLLLDWMLVIVVGWLIVGAAGLFALHRFAWVSRVLFPAGGLLGLVMFGLGFGAAPGPPEIAVFPIGLPQLPFHFPVG